MTPRLRHYVCGRTTHDLADMFRGADRGVREFPSGVFLYEAGDDRRVLFDTGYAAGDWHTGWQGSVYRRLLPPLVEAADDIAVQLQRDGVDPASISHVVLSHLHPDHVGGVSRFPDATFVLTEGLGRTLATPRLREGVLRGLLPDWFPQASRRVLTRSDFAPVEIAGVAVSAADLFGDGSYLVLDLPGHANGHVGAVIDHRIVLAGDAAWGSDLIGAAPRLRTLPRLVQHDMVAYRETAARLQSLAAAGVRVVCSHDPLQDTDLLP
jgi:glyoxylase-like metal-dependent hydrolase (beta-lactamase superfamily II)